MAIASIVIVGWISGAAILKTVLPGLTTMKANTAFGLVAAAAALFWLQSHPERMVQHIAVTVLAVVTGMLGAGTLIEYLSGLNLNMDELIFADPDTTSAPFNGRMSPATAIAFIGLGASVFFLSIRTRRTVLAAHSLAAIPAAFGGLSLVGYAYGVERLYNFGPYVSVAVNTAICLCALAAVVMLTFADDGWRKTLLERPIARAVLRRFLPWSIFAPISIGYIVLFGAKNEYYEALYSPAIFAALTSGVFIWLAIMATAGVRRAETQAISSEQQFRTISEASPNHVWVAGPDGSLTWANEQVYAYTGDGERTLGRGWTDSVHPDDLSATNAAWSKSLASGNSYRTEFWIRDAHGSYRWFLALAEPIRDTSGEITQWVGTNTGTDNFKTLQSQLREINQTLEDRVEQRSRDLLIAEEQLRQSQKMEAVGQLTGGIAHDFNNLLTGITGSLDMLSTRISQVRHNEVDRYISTAQSAAKRAAALTHRLLAFSRRQTLDPRPADINRLVAGMEELVRRTVGPSIVVETVAAGGLWTTLVDASQLENALLNLCINARDAMRDGGRLTIETANRWLDEGTSRARAVTPGQYISLCVTDTGIGMSADVVARAFDPFYTTKPIGEGTGLGLSMIYGFARQSGGHAQIYSELGKGSTVCLYLPRHLGVADAPEPDSAVSQAAHPSVNAKRVLVVEDEPSVRMLIIDVLQELGHSTLEAHDSSTGLGILQSKEALDLLITDVGLPGGLNGRQMVDAIRATRPELKVLFITGFAENAVFGNGYLDPGMHLLTKPFSVDALSIQIKILLDK